MPILDIVSLTFVKALAILLRQPQHTINVSHMPFCAFVWHKRGAQAHFSCAPCSDTDTKHLVIVPCFSVFFSPLLYTRVRARVVCGTLLLLVHTIPLFKARVLLCTRKWLKWPTIRFSLVYFHSQQ